MLVKLWVFLENSHKKAWKNREKYRFFHAFLLRKEHMFGIIDKRTK